MTDGVILSAAMPHNTRPRRDDLRLARMLAAEGCDRDYESTSADNAPVFVLFFLPLILFVFLLFVAIPSLLVAALLHSRVARRVAADRPNSKSQRRTRARSAATSAVEGSTRGDLRQRT